MQNNSVELKALENLIEYQRNIYAEAIRNNLQFENVKNIFLKIKKLEKEADKLMQQQAAEKMINCSARDEMHFSKIKREFITKTQEYIATLENLTLEDMLDAGVYSNLASLRYNSVLSATKMGELILQTIAQNNKAIIHNATTKLK